MDVPTLYFQIVTAHTYDQLLQINEKTEIYYSNVHFKRRYITLL